MFSLGLPIAIQLFGKSDKMWVNMKPKFVVTQLLNREALTI